MVLYFANCSQQFTETVNICNGNWPREKYAYLVYNYIYCVNNCWQYWAIFTTICSCEWCLFILFYLIFEYFIVMIIFLRRLVVSRLETNVLRILKPYFPTAKDENVKLSLIKAVNLFGKAVKQCSVDAEFAFSRKTELLKHMEVGRVAFELLHCCHKQNFVLLRPGYTIVFSLMLHDLFQYWHCNEKQRSCKIPTFTSRFDRICFF